MSDVIDARGLACPHPVLMTKKAMESGRVVTVLVSARDQVDNVIRMAERSGWSTAARETEDHWEIVLEKPGSVAQIDIHPEDLVCQMPGRTGYASRTVVLTSEGMGHGSPELARVLIRSFLGTLKEVKSRPNRIIFYNSAVKLVSEGTHVLPELKELADLEIDLIVCGTCLDFFHLKDKLLVGRVSNMYEIATLLCESGNTVTI